MIRELKIKNGDIGLEFDPFNTIYTVNVSESVKILEFDYKLDEGTNINIIGNLLDYGVNEVILDVSNGADKMRYTFFVNKEKEDYVNKEVTHNIELEVNENVLYHVPACIAGGVFLVILITFTLLFKKSKKNRN